MVLSVMQKRRSIRKYSDKPVEKEKLDSLIEAALRAPSSRGRNPWEFIVVSNKDTLKALSKAKTHGSSFLAGSALGIVVCGDDTVSDMWIEDASISSVHILLEAESLDLGACWIQIRGRDHDDSTTAEEYIRGVLDIPENLRILNVISVGYSDETKEGHAKESLKYDSIHYDSW